MLKKLRMRFVLKVFGDLLHHGDFDIRAFLVHFLFFNQASVNPAPMAEFAPSAFGKVVVGEFGAHLVKRRKRTIAAVLRSQRIRKK